LIKRMEEKEIKYSSAGTMLAAVLHNFDDIRLEQVPKPKITQSDEVVVKIKSVGICQTDFKAFKGIRKNVTFPSIHGHEPSGIVVEVGLNVIDFKVGDACIISPLSYCGYCKNCRLNQHHFCDHSAVYGGDGPDNFKPGALAEYMLTKECCLYHKPSNISFDAACLTEPLAGAVKGTILYSQVQLGEDVVVIGVGGIGLLVAMVAAAAGAKVIAVDISAHARENALKNGASHAVDPTKGNVKEEIYKIIPEGPDVVIEAAGNIEAVRLMVDLRRRGTRWNVFGITTPQKFELEGGETHWLEGRMDASFGSHPLAFQRAIKLIQGGLVNTEKIISHRFPLNKIHDAIETFASAKDRNKIVIQVCP